MGIITLSIIFIILISLLYFIDYKIKQNKKAWVKAYNANSEFYELSIDKKKYKVQTHEVYHKFTSFKGFTSSYLLRDSISFRERKEGRYYIIESYRNISSAKMKKSYISPDVFSIDLSGQTILAWINKDELNKKFAGTEENPIKIFKIEYNSKEYLDDSYFQNVELYTALFKPDQTLQFLFISGLGIVIIGVIFGIKLLVAIYQLFIE